MPRRAKEISEAKKELIIYYLKAGMIAKNIENSLEVPKSSVQNVITRFRERVNTINAPRTGRPEDHQN